MKAMKSFIRLLTVALMIGLLPFISVARKQSGQKVPADFAYPPSQETVQIDAGIKSRSLSGVVVDPSGAATSKVLVERLEPGWGKRIGAVFSDTDGRFTFPGLRSGTHFLRVSMPGFNTMLLKVKVTAKTRSTLRIDLHVSN